MNRESYGTRSYTVADRPERGKVLVLNPEGIRAMDWAVGVDGDHAACLGLAEEFCQRLNRNLRGDTLAPVRDSYGKLY